MNELYEYIKSQIPQIDGYGECGKNIDENMISNHDVFFQSLREDHEGDIGIFLITGGENTELIFGKVYESEIQIVVNSVNGDIACTLNILEKTLDNIRNNKKGNRIYVSKAGLINLRPVGKNNNGIQWSVMNILCKYSKLKQD